MPIGVLSSYKIEQGYFQKYNSRKVTQMTKNGNARTVYAGSNRSLYYQKAVILPVLVTTHLPYPFILPCFSLANLVQPTRLSSTALLLAGYFISSLPPIKDWGIPMK